MGLRDAGVWLGLVEQDDEPLYDDGPEADEAEPAVDTRAGSRRRYGLPVAPAPEAEADLQIAVMTPQTFRDAATIGEYFRQDIPVIINLHDLDDAAAKRIVDFACGLVFGRRGAIERVSGRIYLIVPRDSAILKDRGAVPGTEFYNQT
jgi:cell division inhibitor SepF